MASTRWPPKSWAAACMSALARSSAAIAARMAGWRPLGGLCWPPGSPGGVVGGGVVCASEEYARPEKQIRQATDRSRRSLLFMAGLWEAIPSLAAMCGEPGSQELGGFAGARNPSCSPPRGARIRQECRPQARPPTPSSPRRGALLALGLDRGQSLGHRRQGVEPGKGLGAEQGCARRLLRLAHRAHDDGSEYLGLELDPVARPGGPVLHEDHAFVRGEIQAHVLCGIARKVADLQGMLRAVAAQRGPLFARRPRGWAGARYGLTSFADSPERWPPCGGFCALERPSARSSH